MHIKGRHHVFGLRLVHYRLFKKLHAVVEVGCAEHQGAFPGNEKQRPVSGRMDEGSAWLMGSIHRGNTRWLPRRGRKCRWGFGDGCSFSAQAPVALTTVLAETSRTTPVSVSSRPTPATFPFRSRLTRTTRV